MYKDTSYLGSKLPQVTFSKRNKHSSFGLMEQNKTKHLLTNGKALQAYPSQTCGHKVNDRFIGQALQRVSLRNPERWEHAGPFPFEQSCTSRLEM